MLFLTARGGGTEGGKPLVDRDQRRQTRIHGIFQQLIMLIVIFSTLGVLVFSIMELLRLHKVGWGVGLLPFVPATSFLASLLFLLRNIPPKAYGYRSRFSGGWRARVGSRVFPFYLLMVVVLAIKLNTLVKLNRRFPRRGTAYPMSEEIRDVAATMGFMALLLVSTVLGMILDRSSR